MGEIAEMMLDGTMDPETGEFNFDGEDGPGWPMTASEAAAYQRAARNPHSPPGQGTKKTQKRNARRKAERLRRLEQESPP